MKLFFSYLRQHRKGICAFALFTAVFSVTFYLYRLPLEAVCYPALLCLLFGTVFLVLDFSQVCRRHRLLQGYFTMPSAMLPAMPEAWGILEADYHALIRALQDEAADQNTQFQTRYQDMVEYYTAWVHQVKTPIASMQLTLQNEDTPLARKLSTELFRIEQYVGMVLAFLRLDSAFSDYVFQEHSIDSIVGPSVARFASEFISRRIRLDYDPIMESVITDEKWFSFVIEQFLSNALKYTPDGTIRIYLNPPKILCIEDTGIGIAPEDLPRIFEKGYTGYNGRMDKKASGIGLYLCKRICNNLGIGIRVTSEPGRGTTFFLDLSQYDLKTE